MKKIGISKAKIKKLYWDEKLSISKIAEKLCVGEWFVWQEMNKKGIRRRSLSEANTLNNLSRKISISKKTLENLYIHQGWPTTKIAKMFSCHHSVILRRMGELGIKSRNLSEAMTKYSKNDFSGDFVEKAYLLGFRSGDLYVKRINPKGQVIRVECSTTSPGQIGLIKKLFSKYGHKYEYNFKGFRNEVRICYYLNNSFKFLLEKNKKVDKWILGNQKYFFAFLAGYIDAEGSIKIYGNKNCIEQARFTLATYDKTILRQIREKLISIGITCGILRIFSSKGYRTKRKPLPNKQDYYGFNICSKKSLLKLFNSIRGNIKHPDKFQDMKDAKENIKWRNEIFGNLRMG
jgi:hypothetical protein